MLKKIDMLGKKFNKLTVIADAGSNKNGRAMWLCQCDCGNQTVVMGKYIRNGHTKSCGCAIKDVDRSKLRKHNEYYVWNKVVFVKFSNTNKYFICDLEDWEKLKKYTWHDDGNGYTITQENGNKFKMHRVIMNAKENDIIDHIKRISDGGVCDNRKSNLRKSTKSTNAMNSKINSNNTSGVTGVGWHKKHNKWQSSITINYNKIYLGIYEKLEDAIVARLRAENEYFGEFAPQKHLFKKYGIS